MTEPTPISKTALRVAGMESVGSALDDLLENAEKASAAVQGTSLGLTKAKEHVQTIIGETKAKLDAKEIEMEVANEVIRALSDASIRIVQEMQDFIKAEARAEGFRDALKMAVEKAAGVRNQELAQDQVRAIREVPQAAVSADGAPAGRVPIKQRRQAEEAAQAPTGALEAAAKAANEAIKKSKVTKKPAKKKKVAKKKVAKKKATAKKAG